MLLRVSFFYLYLKEVLMDEIGAAKGLLIHIA